jgi:vitamin B12 transporter
MSLDRSVAAALLILSWAAPALADEPAPLEVVVPGAPRSPLDPRDPTAATYVVHREYLRAPGATAADALSAVPGVEVTRSGAASEPSTAGVRGATSAQTPVYLAGIRLNDDLTGTADLSTVPLWMLDRIEIYRGNAPSEADRLGIGGAIFLEPVHPGSSRVGAGAGVGSFGELGAWASGALAAPSASALVTVRRDAAENDYSYVDDAGTRFISSDDVKKTRTNADSKSYVGWGIGRVSLSPRSELVFLSNVFVREQGVTGLSSDPARAARLRTKRAVGGISSKFPCSGEARSGCEIELVTSGLASDLGLTDPERKFGLGSVSIDTETQRVAQRERLQLEIGQALSLTIAASEEAERIVIDGAEGPMLRARRDFGRMATTLLFRATDALEIFGLGSLQCDRTEGPGLRGRCDASATGRAGLRVKPNPEVALSANAGRYERVPTLGERYGLSSALRGNAFLDAETGWTADVGARWAQLGRAGAIRRAYAEAFAFSRFASELIAFRRSTYNAATPYNVGKARVSGLEVALGGEAFSAIHAELSVTAIDPRDTSEGRTLRNDVLPFRSRLVVAPLLDVFAQPSTRPLGLDRVSWGARAVYRSSEFADPAGFIVIPEQLAVDALMELSFARQTVVARLRVANVFDAPSFDIVGYPLPGRSVHASLEAWWP